MDYRYRGYYEQAAAVNQQQPYASPFVLLPYHSIPPGYGGLIHVPLLNDVLCGRGGRINSHEGNIKFRKIVNMYKQDYLSKSSTKVRKARLAACIVSQVRSSVPPGRFLKIDPATGLWIDIGDDKARKKAGQALREDASKFRSAQKENEANEAEKPQKEETALKWAPRDIFNTEPGYHKLTHCVKPASAVEIATPPPISSQGNSVNQATLVTPIPEDSSRLVANKVINSSEGESLIPINDSFNIKEDQAATILECKKSAEMSKESEDQSVVSKRETDQSVASATMSKDNKDQTFIAEGNNDQFVMRDEEDQLANLSKGSDDTSVTLSKVDQDQLSTSPKVTGDQLQIITREAHEIKPTSLLEGNINQSVTKITFECATLGSGDKTIDSYTLGAVMEMEELSEIHDTAEGPGSSSHVGHEKSSQMGREHSDDESKSNFDDRVRNSADITSQMVNLNLKKGTDLPSHQSKKSARKEWRQQLLPLKSWRRVKEKIIEDDDDNSDSAVAGSFNEDRSIASANNKVEEHTVSLDSTYDEFSKDESFKKIFSPKSIRRKMFPFKLRRNRSSSSSVEKSADCMSMSSTNISLKDMMSLDDDSKSALRGNFVDDMSWLSSFKTMKSISTGGTSLSDLTPEKLSFDKNLILPKAVEKASC